MGSGLAWNLTMAKTVMVIDDSRSTRQLVSLTLTKAGYSVLEASDGVDALRQLEGARVHLMICDVNMPNMDGLTFARRVKELPSHKFTPIVMLTTEGADALIAQGKAAGAKGWMVKPFRTEQLLDVVGRLAPT
jgi:two-component system, chemotaxis family, chemotaxis protein CheY